MDVDIRFKELSCPKCGCNEQKAVYRMRWGLYCKECNKFIKWASNTEKTVILARVAYLQQ